VLFTATTGITQATLSMTLRRGVTYWVGLRQSFTGAAATRGCLVSKVSNATAILANAIWLRSSWIRRIGR